MTIILMYTLKHTSYVYACSTVFGLDSVEFALAEVFSANVSLEAGGLTMDTMSLLSDAVGTLRHHLGEGEENSVTREAEEDLRACRILIHKQKKIEIDAKKRTELLPRLGLVHSFDRDSRELQVKVNNSSADFIAKLIASAAATATATGGSGAESKEGSAVAVELEGGLEGDGDVELHREVGQDLDDELYTIPYDHPKLVWYATPEFLERLETQPDGSGLKKHEQAVSVKVRSLKVHTRGHNSRGKTPPVSPSGRIGSSYLSPAVTPSDGERPLSNYGRGAYSTNNAYSTYTSSIKNVEINTPFKPKSRNRAVSSGSRGGSSPRRESRDAGSVSSRNSSLYDVEEEEEDPRYMGSGGRTAQDPDARMSNNEHIARNAGVPTFAESLAAYNAVPAASLHAGREDDDDESASGVYPPATLEEALERIKQQQQKEQELEDGEGDCEDDGGGDETGRGNVAELHSPVRVVLPSEQFQVRGNSATRDKHEIEAGADDGSQRTISTEDGSVSKEKENGKEEEGELRAPSPIEKEDSGAEQAQTKTKSGEVEDRARANLVKLKLSQEKEKEKTDPMPIGGIGESSSAGQPVPVLVVVLPGLSLDQWDCAYLCSYLEAQGLPNAAAACRTHDIDGATAEHLGREGWLEIEAGSAVERAKTLAAIGRAVSAAASTQSQGSPTSVENNPSDQSSGNSPKTKTKNARKVKIAGESKSTGEGDEERERGESSSSSGANARTGSSNETSSVPDLSPSRNRSPTLLGRLWGSISGQGSGTNSPEKTPEKHQLSGSHPAMAIRVASPKQQHPKVVAAGVQAAMEHAAGQVGHGGGYEDSDGDDGEYNDNNDNDNQCASTGASNIDRKGDRKSDRAGSGGASHTFMVHRYDSAKSDKKQGGHTAKVAPHDSPGKVGGRKVVPLEY